MEQKKYMVNVRCITFNQSQYINDAMDGFAMQETTFPYVCTVIDDASIDGEQEVIRKYLEEHFDLEDKSVVRNENTDDYVLCFARHKTNKKCYFAVLFLKYNHYSIKKTKLPYFREWQADSKYTSTCEGDDFWIDSRKLQMQVDFMEAHPDYSLCHSDVIYYNSDKKESQGRIGRLMGKLKSKPYTSKQDILERIVTSKYGAIYLTILFRNDLYEKIPQNDRKLMMGDAPLLIDMSQQGFVHYFPVVLGTYRIHNGSRTRQNESKNRRFGLGIQEMFVYYCQKYGYKVPFLVKFRYNTSYMSCLIKDGKISPEASYDIFETFLYHKRLLKNRYYYLLFRKFLFPLIERFVAAIGIYRTKYRRFTNRKLEEYTWTPK